MKYKKFIDAINKHSSDLEYTLSDLYRTIHLDNNPESMVVFDEETEEEIFKTINSLLDAISSNVSKLQELLPRAVDTDNQEEISEKVDLVTLQKQIKSGIMRPAAPSKDPNRAKVWNTFKQSLKNKTTEDLHTMLSAFEGIPGFDANLQAVKNELATRT